MLDYFGAKLLTMDLLKGIDVDKIKNKNEQSNKLVNDENPHLKWELFLKFVQKNISKIAFKTWFQPLKLLSIEKNEVVITVPSQFYSEWLDEHYYSLIRTGLQTLFGENIKLKYQVVIDNSSKDETSFSLKILSSNTTNREQIRTNALQSLDYDPHLISDYLFENFLVGESNSFAYTLALEIAKGPNTSRYNPLTILGRSGIGKTHLLHSIGNFILLNHPSVRVWYSTSEDFTNNFIDSLKNGTTSQWTSMIQTLDVLLIDDIQFFSNKQKIQEQFYQLFHKLIQLGKQIVITCDKHPSEINNLNPKLVSSINWGIIAKIESPDYEMRLTFIRRKCEAEGLPLTEDVMQYIADKVGGSFRDINGVIISLLANLTFSNKSLDIYLVKEILRNKRLIDFNPITIEFIIDQVEKYYNLPKGSLVSKSRKKEISTPRHLAIYLAKELTNNTLKVIGKKFGNRDHTTILHAINVTEKNLLLNDAIRTNYNYLLKKLI
ncbi:MAG: chromosomal replication initiator protein DnaA [Candidatus Kapaibacteriales bacterium]